MFACLHENYGKIANADLLENKETMTQDWDSETLIQNAFKHIEDGTKCVALGEIVTSEKEKIAIGYKLIHQTGELTTACRD